MFNLFASLFHVPSIHAYVYFCVHFLYLRVCKSILFTNIIQHAPYSRLYIFHQFLFIRICLLFKFDFVFLFNQPSKLFYLSSFRAISSCFTYVLVSLYKFYKSIIITFYETSKFFILSIQTLFYLSMQLASSLF